MQPVAEVRTGELLLGVGLAYGAAAVFPLSGLTGDLLSVARTTVAFGLGPRILVEVRGSAYEVLRIRERGPSAVPLEPDVEDGTTSDHGDFRIGVLFAPLGSARGLAAGARLEVKLPNSDEGKGIGTNTTDFRGSLLGSLGAGRWRLTADMGVGILEAPLQTFEQNDVVVYSAELLYRLPGGRGRLAAGVDGRASTRGRVPLGTEDLGEVQLGGEYRLGGWLLDASLTAGYAGNSPDWGVRTGLARRLGGKDGR